MKVNKYQGLLLVALNGTEEGNGKTRTEIVNMINSPRTTIYMNLRKLSKKGLVKKYTEERETRGRPKVYWYLTPKGHKATEITMKQIRVNNNG